MVAYVTVPYVIRQLTLRYPSLPYVFFLQYFTLRCLMLRYPGHRNSGYIKLLFILANYLSPHFLMLVYDKDGLSSLIRNMFYTPTFSNTPNHVETLHGLLHLRVSTSPPPPSPILFTTASMSSTSSYPNGELNKKAFTDKINFMKSKFTLEEFS